MIGEIDSIIRDIRETYLEDQKPWIIGFSGGKDSTALLKLVFVALRGINMDSLKKKIHIICCDTKVESPNILNYLEESLVIIEQAAKKSGLPFTVRKLTPPIKDRFFANLIGRGYPAPNKWFRWCTDRLKIRPSTEYIKSIASTGDVIILLGLRANESSNRNASMENFRIANSKFNRHTKIKNAHVYMPIKTLTSEDIWILLSSSAPWGGNHQIIRFLYKQANGNECPFFLDKSAPTCGNSRFGCWVCTVIDKDRSMEGFIEYGGNDSLKPLLDFRNYINKKRNDLSCREQSQRNGKNGPGPFKLQFRVGLYKKLIETELKSNHKLIEDAEKERIQFLWNLDGYRGKNIYLIDREISKEICGNAS